MWPFVTVFPFKLHFLSVIRVYILQKPSFNFHFEKWARAPLFPAECLICSALPVEHHRPGFCQQPAGVTALGHAVRFFPAAVVTREDTRLSDSENALSAFLYLASLSRSISVRHSLPPELGAAVGNEFFVYF